MRDVAGLYTAGLNVPEFLDAYAVALRIDVVQIFGRNELLSEGTARAFGKDSNFGAEFVARREVVFGLAIFVEALVFRDHAGNAGAFVNQFGAAKFLEDVHSTCFHESPEPFRDFAERDDVVALVLERRRSDRETERRLLGEKQRGGIGDRSVQRRGLFEIRNEFGEGFGVHDGAGKLVRADFTAFFEDVDVFRGELGLRAGGVVLFDEIGKVERAGEAGRASADDEDIGFQLFAYDGHGLILTDDD